MSVHRRRTSYMHRGQRRKLVWSTIQETVPSIPSLSSTGVDLLTPLEAAGASKLGVTVMRTLVYVQCTFSAVQDNYVFGLIVDDAPAAVTIDPFANPELDWAFLQRRWSVATGATVDAQREFFWDVRSKRKCEEMGETWALAISNQTNAAQTPHIFVRTLLALP